MFSIEHVVIKWADIGATLIKFLAVIHIHAALSLLASCSSNTEVFQRVQPGLNLTGAGKFLSVTQRQIVVLVTPYRSATFLSEIYLLFIATPRFS